VTCYKSVVFSTNKTDRHYRTEILLKMALNTINLFFEIAKSPMYSNKTYISTLASFNPSEMLIVAVTMLVESIFNGYHRSFKIIHVSFYFAM